jgi:steroid 5-alpha reductase family enzyme
MSNAEMIFTAAVFFSGWILTRGANLQKHAAKRDPSATSCFGGLISLEYLSAGGRNSGLLVSGFWGLARHLNYLGEIIQAIALSIPAGRGSWVPWLYPLYYVGLFVGRMIDDDQLCAAKYGKETWDGYKQSVPHWIIPYII